MQSLVGLLQLVMELLHKALDSSIYRGEDTGLQVGALLDEGLRHGAIAAWMDSKISCASGVRAAMISARRDLVLHQHYMGEEKEGLLTWRQVGPDRWTYHVSYGLRC
ncbi:hypothetical protein BRADI_2g23134v3 [Brachypodium distachyon]|uniref:Uncharacterized protein n=1 Tax=Brachypodium distachyon TaxID=15368 RepID=A0A2K2DA00_BRADI|nr:hypothetical protein BRADI_2g23134v3 [Brachypodium distachyon]